MNCEVPPCPCTANTDNRLKLYAFTAAATGVSMLALAKSREARGTTRCPIHGCNNI
jgi:hypothetical protein